MELELKHLAPYLAYKLPAKLSQQGIFNLDLEYPDENTHKLGYIDNFYFNDGDFCGIIRISEKKSFDFEEEDFEIVLRPLSDLTKEIEVNGVKFVPSEKLAIHMFDYDFLDYVVNKKETNGIPYWVMEKLFEWHFDVFGLIEAGLAIDINTLK